MRRIHLVTTFTGALLLLCLWPPKPKPPAPSVAPTLGKWKRTPAKPASATRKARWRAPAAVSSAGPRS